MKRAAAFTLTCLTIVAAALLVLRWWMDDPVAHRALWISAALALVTQLVTFAIARRMAQRNAVAGWGAGVGVRFLVLAVYGVIGIRLLALPLAPALLSLAVFLFLTTLVEPLFLQT